MTREEIIEAIGDDLYLSIRMDCVNSPKDHAAELLRRLEAWGLVIVEKEK